jgi:hypothetical protein
MLRLGKHVNTYRNIMARIKKSPADKEFNDILKSLADISNALYFLLDHILLVNKLNLFKFDPTWIAKVDWYSNLAWGGECFFNIIYDLVDYRNNVLILETYKNNLNKIDNTKSNGKYNIIIHIEYVALIEKRDKLIYEQFKKIVDILRCSFDMPV